ncbi:T9SS type A sorting domain-containing protein [Puia sp.]|jgi:hypothetical protein|uniref:T9SS type A sorting domain-containing protein n=1 Tax=Puia sp. TaxID=2045100 RepID=UPI002F3FDA0C
MKPQFFLRGLLTPLLFFYLPIFSLLPAFGPASAQTPVTAEFAHWVTVTTSTTYAGTGATGNAGSGLNLNHYNYAFGHSVTTPNLYLLDSFTAVGMIFRFTAGTKVRFRRADNASVAGLRKSLWLEQNNGATVPSGGTVALRPDYDDSLERIFSSGQVFNIGIDNNFQNSTNTNNNNIERVDFLLSAAGSSTDGTKAGFAVFDRGAGGGHDPFYVAAIKTVDANGDPSSYYGAVSVTAANYGSNVGTSINYLTLRKNPADAHLFLMNNTSNQFRDGVLLRFSDLGIPNGATTYGYSLFGTDVNISSAANLVDYTNAANFPTGSDFSGGGLDQVAVTGLWVTNTSLVVLADRVVDFSARAEGGKVQLNWTLGTINDCSRLVVERSADAVNFFPLLEYEAPLANGQTVLDQQPFPGHDDYRLKLVDQQSAVVAYSAVCRVELPAGDAGVHLSVYPNPVVGRKLNFSGEGLTPGIYQLGLLDMSGRLLAKREFSGGAAFSGSLALPAALAPGVYGLVVTDSKGGRWMSTTVEVPAGQ